MAIRKSTESSIATKKRASETFDKIDDSTEYNKHFRAKQKVSIATRIEPEYKEELEKYAIEQNKRLSSILNEWIVERMREENIIPK